MLSEELRRERESRGVSLDRMAHETRISIHFLRAIESGDLEALPGAFYRKAFLRAYARFVGLPQERVLAAYDYYGAAESVRRRPKDPPKPVFIPPPRRGSPRLTGRTRTAVALSLVPLLMLGAVVTGAGTFWPGRGPASGPVPTESDNPRWAAPPSPEFELPFVPEECERGGPAGASEGPAEGLHLVLEVTDSCWLEVRTDGVLVSAGTLAGGQREEFRAEREVRLSLGNAGGVSLRINGSPGKPLGKRGQPLKNLRITRDNFRQFVAS